MTTGRKKKRENSFSHLFEDAFVSPYLSFSFPLSHSNRMNEKDSFTSVSIGIGKHTTPRETDCFTSSHGAVDSGVCTPMHIPALTGSLHSKRKEAQCIYIVHVHHQEILP